MAKRPTCLSDCGDGLRVQWNRSPALWARETAPERPASSGCFEVRDRIMAWMPRGDRVSEGTNRPRVDCQPILAFAERILPRFSDLWVQPSLDYKQRLQQLFFPEGIAFDGDRFNRTAITAPLFNYLAPSESADEKKGCEVRLRQGYRG
jgi:hypothetical protein